MLGDYYVNGAVILSTSIRKHNSLSDANIDLVCMVTPDVSENAIRLLYNYYDRVVRVQFIFNHTECKTEKQTSIYGPWINVCFTKWNVFALDEYAKIMFLDSDVLVVGSILELLDYETPAGIMDTDHNAGRGAQDTKGAVSVQEISRRLQRFQPVMDATCLVIEPSKSSWREMQEMLYKNEFFSNKNPSGPDEVLLAQHCAYKKQEIHKLPKEFGLTFWKNAERTGGAKILNFRGTKPWDNDNADSSWEDVRIWQSYVTDEIRDRLVEHGIPKSKVKYSMDRMDNRVVLMVERQRFFLMYRQLVAAPLQVLLKR